MPSWQELGVEDYNQGFLKAPTMMDRAIVKRQPLRVSPWRTMIPRGEFQLGQGLIKKIPRFFPGLGDQAGLDLWRAIRISELADGNNAEYDACTPQPYLVDYGFDTYTYSGFVTERRTKHICINDIKWTWEFRQQLGLIMGFLADYTNEVWSNASREFYLKFCADNSNFYAMSTGSPVDNAISYDPLTVDSDNDHVLYVEADKISSLNWKYFKRYNRQSEIEAPGAALGTVDMRPQYGLVLDMDDFDEMIERDDQLREDFRHQNPSVLVTGQNKVKSYKGYALMHDTYAPRFKIKNSDTGGAGGARRYVLKRVKPIDDQVTATIGKKTQLDDDYMNAEFAVAIIFMRDILKWEIPPNGPVNPGGGTMFGAVPGLNGKFAWINNKDNSTNPLGRVGYMLAEYEGFPRPEKYFDKAIAVLYRRCANAEVTTCEIGGTDALASPQTDTSTAAVSGSDVLATVVMPGIVDVEAGDTVTFGGLTAYVAESSSAPTYVLLFQSAANRTTAVAATGTNAMSW